MIKKLAILPILVLMVGCTGDTKFVHSPSYMNTKSNIETLEEEVIASEESIRSSIDNISAVIIQSGIVDDYYVDTEEFEREKEMLLPSEFEYDVQVEVMGSIEQIVDLVSKTLVNATSILLVEEDEEKESQSVEPKDSSPESPFPMPNLGDGMTQNGPPEFPPGYEDAMNNRKKAAPKKKSEEGMIEFAYKGDVLGMVRKLALLKKMRWTFDKTSKTIYFTRNITKSYIVPVRDFKGTNSVSISASSNTKGDATSGNTNSSITSSSSADPWSSLVSSLSDIITESGTFVVNKELGMVEVSDTYKNIVRVDTFMKKIIEMYSQQLLVDIRVIHLSGIESNNKEVNWSSVNNKIGSLIAAASIGNVAQAGQNSFLLNYKEDPAAAENNISTAINLLSKYAESYTVDSFSAVTTNFKTVPIQLSDERVYWEKTSDDGGASSQTVDEDGIISNTANAESTVSYEAKLKQIGTTITLTPSRVEDTITLSYVFQKTDQSAVVNDPEGNPYPLTSTKTFVQQVNLKNSIPMVVSAINTESSENSSSSPLATGAWFFGGNESNIKKNTKDLILVTVSSLKNNFINKKKNYYDADVVPLDVYVDLSN